MSDIRHHVQTVKVQESAFVKLLTEMSQSQKKLGTAIREQDKLKLRND